MIFLILGLVLFLGIHSVRIFADGWRTRFIAQRGEGAWKGAYSVLSIAGFVLLVWGYGQARNNTVALWSPPEGMRHLTALLVLVAFVLLAAAYVPRNGIKARLHHPMILGVKTWAFAHLLSNGTLADIVLFGAFLVWAMLSFRAARARDRAGSVQYASGTRQGTVLTVVVGIAAWAIFAFWAHGVLIGVRPFG